MMNKCGVAERARRHELEDQRCPTSTIFHHQLARELRPRTSCQRTKLQLQANQRIESQPIKLLSSLHLNPTRMPPPMVTSKMVMLRTLNCLASSSICRMTNNLRQEVLIRLGDRTRTELPTVPSSTMGGVSNTSSSSMMTPAIPPNSKHKGPQHSARAEVRQTNILREMRVDHLHSPGQQVTRLRLLHYLNSNK